MYLNGSMNDNKHPNEAVLVKASWFPAKVTNRWHTRQWKNHGTGLNKRCFQHLAATWNLQNQYDHYVSTVGIHKHINQISIGLWPLAENQPISQGRNPSSLDHWGLFRILEKNVNYFLNVCNILVGQITRQNPHSQQIVKHALFLVLYDHYMFQPSQEAIFRWLLVNTKKKYQCHYSLNKGSV
jgi:hypothetical protein